MYLILTLTKFYMANTNLHKNEKSSFTFLQQLKNTKYEDYSFVINQYY